MKQGKKLSWKNFPISILLAVSALICIVPFWLVLVSSLTPEADIIWILAVSKADRFYGV